METLNDVNTAVTETFHKTVKESYHHTNKVDYIKQMCFWDDRWLSVEIHRAALTYITQHKVGAFSNHTCTQAQPEHQPKRTAPLLAGVQKQ